MRYYFYFLLIAVQLIAANSPVLATASMKNQLFEINNTKKNKKLAYFNKTPTTNEKMDVKKWLPLALGILGLAFIFIPYLSLLGLIAGIAAVVTGFLFRKKYPKTARWGIWLGAICIVAFLAVLGLILFF